MIRPIRALSRQDNPTPNNGGTWGEFLKMIKPELFEAICGVQFLRSSVNHNYILFPNGVVVQNFGGNWSSIYHSIERIGWRRTLAKIITTRRQVLACIRDSRKRLVALSN